MPLPDPTTVAVDEDAIYLQLTGVSPGVSRLPHPNAESARAPGEWAGAANISTTPNDRQDEGVVVNAVKRGRWELTYVETHDEALADGLEDAGHERLKPREFADRLEEAPDCVYLRAATDRIAEDALQLKGVTKLTLNDAAASMEEPE